MDVKALNLRNEETHPMTRSLLRDAMSTLKKAAEKHAEADHGRKLPTSRDGKPDRRR